MGRKKKFQNKKSKLSPSILFRLSQVFERKQWDKTDSLQNGIFQRYINTLSALDEDCQNLMLELTSRFIYIHGTDYDQCLVKLIDGISNKYPSKEIYIARDFQCYFSKKPKSSDVVFYKIEGIGVKTQLQKEPTFLEDVDKTEAKGFPTDAILVIVDDFVGTGQTMSEAVNNYMIYLSIPKERIVVLTIAIMSKGLNRLNSEGINVESFMTLNRGISDFYHGKLLNRNIRLMKKIEDDIYGLKNEYRFGYKQSESLVCMEKCPNNYCCPLNMLYTLVINMLV